MIVWARLNERGLGHRNRTAWGWPPYASPGWRPMTNDVSPGGFGWDTYEDLTRIPDPFYDFKMWAGMEEVLDSFGEVT